MGCGLYFRGWTQLSGGVLFSVGVDITIGSLQYDLLCFLRRLKSIWHEQSFLSVKTSVLKNSKLKIWENSDKATRSYDRLNFPIFAQNLVLFAALPKPCHVTKNTVVTSSGWFVNSFGSKTQQIRRKIPWSWLKQRISYKNTSYTHGVTIHQFPCDPETRGKCTKFVSLYFQKRIM